ncbi:hypothetical protein Pcinc_043339 [Petrolisthes cinctipes]|uniref:Uncharacterized protein n=1 Tax=Petrolisthes cinctipes TaxID=88211 RepID=A0AAE1BHU2_PETCI|nr:hypothetical protein Pcinc_043339 [Petrolisthes cinctipes]
MSSDEPSIFPASPSSANHHLTKLTFFPISALPTPLLPYPNPPYSPLPHPSPPYSPLPHLCPLTKLPHPSPPYILPASPSQPSPLLSSPSQPSLYTPRLPLLFCQSPPDQALAKSRCYIKNQLAATD